ncbi:MAG TPA: hypothetical protein VFO17_10725 [Acidimicrobiia bacterium]|jgi:hypothetical protein|nr:hypothetical protein [Acidimicrobiia bacterium]
MAKGTRAKIRRALGVEDARREGYRRSLKGLREGDYRELSLGLALALFAHLRDTKPRKELIYRRTLREGSALVIHHKKRGEPRLEIIKPKK